MSAPLEQLIAALEAATGPSRELDLAICRVALNSEPLGHAAGMDDSLLLMQRVGLYPRYTSSLDAALMLVPEGWASGSIAEERRVIGYVHNNQPAFIGVGARDNPAKIWHEVRHPVRAIALCIAALKARAA